MLPPIKRAHFCNIENFRLFITAAISYSYQQELILTTEFISLNAYSQQLRKTVDICLRAINSFTYNFKIERSVITEVINNTNNSNLLILLEVLLYSGLNNKDIYQILREHIRKYNPDIPRLYYYLYVYRCETAKKNGTGINHCYWPAKNFINTSYYSHEITTYPPFYSLSFGHPTFIFDALFNVEESNSSIPKAIFYEPEQFLTTYTEVGSIANLLKEPTLKRISIKNTSSLVLTPKTSKDIIHSGHLSWVNLMKRTRIKHGYISYAENYSITTHVRSSPIIDNIRACPFLKEPISHSTNLLNFVSNAERIAVIHTRDSAYSYGSSIRDVDFSNYLNAIEYLIEQGISVVRISRSSKEFSFINTKFLDMSIGSDYTLQDQLYVLANSDYFIGTSSGISHWATYYGVELMFLNTSALPATQLTDSVLHSPKNIAFKHNISSNIMLETFLKIISSTVDELDLKVIEYFDLSPRQVTQEIKYFISTCNDRPRSWVSIHSFLQDRLGYIPDIPDYYISELTSINFDQILNDILY